MKRIFIAAMLFMLPVLSFAGSCTVIKADADIKNGVIRGTVDKVKFSAPLSGDGHTFILSGDWFKAPSDGGYRLELTLPEGYTALAEADKAVKTDKGWTFTLDHPQGAMVLAISDRWTVRTENYKGTELALYFSKENLSASDEYFSRLKTLLDSYTSILGKYPYGRFAVADVPMPVGHALISLTFISDRIVKMPFLVNTSLGHELLHQWFGVAVASDSDSGNWAEGLTTYMADRLYAEQRGDGTKYRMNAMISLTNSARQNDKASVLKDFRYNSGRQQQAVGYAKGMMVFSMLDEMTGDNFNKALRNFYADYAYKTASWADIQKEFEKVFGKKLDGFFAGWLNQPDITSVTLDNIDVKATPDGFKTSFTIKNSDERLEFPLQIIFKADGGDLNSIYYVKGKEVNVTVNSLDRPLEIVVDPEYRTARTQDMEEAKPTMYSLLSTYPKTVFVKPEDRDKYASVIGSLDNAKIVDDTAEPYQYSHSILIFLGQKNAAYTKFFGSEPMTGGDFTAMARNHPLYADRDAYLIDAKDKKIVDSVFPRLMHYGSMGKVTFSGGELKTEESALNPGIHYQLNDDRQGVRVDNQLTIKEILDENPYAKVFYVGETHTNYANHQNQLEVMKRLSEQGEKFAVGLEMIQKPFQQYLDQYVSGQITEKEMLKKTEYYDRWRFDYRLYMPIFRYAREHKIPLVALNTPQELTEKVAAKGIQTLSEEDKKQIPSPFEYTGGDYKERLYDVFTHHKQESFQNFYEAQLLWDETMAQSAYEYMKVNPDRKMVILAGNGHIAYRTAIPERLFRRNSLNYVSILQGEDNVKGIGDYILFPSDVNYEESPKLGVGLDTEKGLKVSDVAKDSAAEKAGIKKDDVIISLNGQKLDGFADVKIVLTYLDYGKDYEITVIRDKKPVTLKIRFSEQAS